MDRAAAIWPDYTMSSRYDDDPEDRRCVTFAPGPFKEIVLTVDGGEPLFFDALDLLRVVSAAVLDGVYGRTPRREVP